jgi:hypothetical protein
MVSYHLPCHQGVSPGLLGGDPTRPQWTASSGGGFVPLASWEEGLGCTTEPGEVQEPERGGEHRLSDW